MSKFITLATFTLPQEAYVVRSRLEAEGITVFLRNELTIQTDNFLSNAMGGVQLQIYQEDLDSALPILKDMDLIPAEIKKEPSRLIIKWQRTTAKIPLIQRLPIELRLFAIIGFLGLSVATTFLVINYPSKEERAYVKELRKQGRAERALIHKYRDLIDDILYIDPEKAKIYIRDLQKDIPNNEELNLYLGIALFQQDSFKLALTAFEKKKLYARFDHSRDYYNIGVTKLRLRDFSGGIEDLNTVVNRYKNHSDMLLGMFDYDKMFIYSEYGLSEYWVYWQKNPAGLEEFPELNEQFISIEKFLLNEDK